MSNGLEAALLERAQRERARRQAAAQAAPERTLGQTIYENVIGSGEVDTPGERFGAAIGDMGRAAAAGLSRGVTGLVDLPGQVIGGAQQLGGQAAAAGLEAAGVDVSPDFRAGLTGAALPQDTTRQLAADVTGGATEFRGETLPGQFAGTVAEFVPGAVAFGGAGAANIARSAVVPGVGSEAAGQLTEDTALEPLARIAGAVAAPAAVNFGSKAFQRLFAKSAETPTIANLRATKNAAYQAADDANVSFTSRDMNRIISRAVKAADDANYVPEVDSQTKAALDILSKRAGRTATLGELDKLRQGLFRRYNADKTQVAILDMIDAIDDTIQQSAAGGELMTAARVANARFKKSELLDDAFTKAADQTASTGSGGNILNKYRQAVTSIINNPKKARWFSQQEIDTMRNFVHGNLPENVLRRIGKLAPGGNGLMSALNLGAVAVEPTMLGVTAAASGAKALADRGARQGAAELQRYLATGQAPVRTAPQIGGPVGGLVSGIPAQRDVQ